MLDFKNILVPTDFSSNSIPALELGCHLAKQNKSVLHVLHIIDQFYKSKPIRDEFNLKRFEQTRFLEAEEELRRFINKVSFQGMPLMEVLKEGKAHEQILLYAKNNNIDLIVIASHGWTGLSHLITGSVANKVLRYSDIPTICVKSNNFVAQKNTATFKSTYAENWVG